MTYVAPSNILSADLVIGVYRLLSVGESTFIPEDCIARFSLLCHCIAVPKNRAYLVENQPTFKSLNRREKQVLTASADGATAREVAELLNITERTVHAYVQSAMEKLKCSTKVHAIMRANRLGLI
jgi:LuxR family quorum sensing-dependent transcriptional regulator